MLLRKLIKALPRPIYKAVMPLKVSAFDVETTGTRPYHGDKIFAYSICRGDKVFIKRIRPGTICPILQDYLYDTEEEKTVHYLKFDLSFLRMAGYDIPEETIWHDTLQMSRLLRNLHFNHSLDFLTYELGGDPDRKYQQIEAEVSERGKAYGDYSRIPVKLFNLYQEADGIRGMMIFYALYPLIIADPRLFEDYVNEIELTKSVQRMEQRGMMLDETGCRKKIQECETGIEEIREKAERDYPNDYFKLNSDVDVARLLYRVHGLPVLKLTPGKKPSVSKETFALLRETHDHPILDTVQKHRSFAKGVSTILGYIKLIDSNGVIHPDLGSNNTVTGRFNCKNPNLQNVSKKKNLKNPFIVSARGCFGARPGYVLLDIDQSGIELKLIVEAADSTKMVNLMKEGEHPHVVACKIFYGPWLPIEKQFISKKESEAQYSAGKNGHFCIAYGGGLPKFAVTIGLSIEEAAIGFNKYYEEFPEIANLATEGAIKVQQTGYIVTPFGRLLQIPHGKHYAWLNYFIQGTAAGIIKRGINAVDRYLRWRWEGKAFMLLTVHDSVMIEFEERAFYDNQFEIYDAITQCMTKIPYIKVPLEVEWKLSRSQWDAAENYRP